jgi:hypothetical protein
MHETLDIPEFISPPEIQEIEQNVLGATNEKTEFVDKWGVWKGKHVTTQHWVPADKLGSVFSLLHEKLRMVLSLPFVIEKGQILESHLAYDLHSDYYVKVDHIKEELNGVPYYTLIIPIADYNSHTVVFNQSAEDYNDFYLYKDKNEPLEKHIDDSSWKTYCSHCWPEDQKYVTLDRACEWQAGKLIGFDRRRFHCSDNFTDKLNQKRAFVLWLREDNE